MGNRLLVVKVSGWLAGGLGRREVDVVIKGHVKGPCADGAVGIFTEVVIQSLCVHARARECRHTSVTLQVWFPTYQ